MELQNEFSVPGNPDDVFEILLDLEQVATCMPGATLTGHDGDEYRGTLKLKVGPIAAAYEGKVLIEDIDRTSRAATLRAAGRELNGQGGAEATIRARVDGNGSGSKVSVQTDVQIRGKAAQFGRGALGEVTQRVMDQFAANLEARLLEGARAAASPAAGEGPSGNGGPRAEPTRADESLDVLSVVALPMLRQAAPAVGGFLLGLVLGLLLRRRTRSPYPLPPHAWGPPPPWPAQPPAAS